MSGVVDAPKGREEEEEADEERGDKDRERMKGTKEQLQRPAGKGNATSKRGKARGACIVRGTTFALVEGVEQVDAVAGGRVMVDG